MAHTSIVEPSTSSVELSTSTFGSGVDNENVDESHLLETDKKPDGSSIFLGLDTTPLRQWLTSAQEKVIELQRSKKELFDRLENEKKGRSDEKNQQDAQIIETQEKELAQRNILEAQITKLEMELAAQKAASEDYVNRLKQESEEKTARIEKYRTKYAEVRQILSCIEQLSQTPSTTCDDDQFV